MIRALIVDDETPARDQVREFLGSEPDVIVVGESADGEEALRQIRTLAPDLLFMDIRMPRIERETVRAFLSSLDAPGGGARRERLAIKVGRKVRFVDLPLIEHISADGDYVEIHLQGKETVRARDSIVELQARLPTARFLRIHRSLIVNVDCVKELRSNKRGGYTLVTTGGHRLSAGATYASAIRALLAK